MKTKSKLRDKIEKVFIDNCEDEDDLLEDDKFVTHTAKITINEILQAFSEELDELATSEDYKSDYKSGWSGQESGECCDKCKMTSPKDPLQAKIGCKNPFQLPETCQCHIPHRKGWLVGYLSAIKEMKEKL